jgi:CRISPR system Cascade subunit CasD
MSAAHNTLFLRLAGPMQSWGTSSRLQLRRTDAYPSKSGVVGMLLCAMGVCREESREELPRLTSLRMGVRVDLAGTVDWDYHTAGAKIGIRSADGKIKKTAKTGEYETLLSRRQYLYDASFLVALQGSADAVDACASALDKPVWPIFLGRKCCVPAEPVFAGTGTFDNLTDALSSVAWRPEIGRTDGNDRSATRTLQAFVEHPRGSPPPDGARLVHDVPRVFGFNSHGSRWVVAGLVTVSVAADYNRPPAREPRKKIPDQTRIDVESRDAGLCVFCKQPFDDLHHLTYERINNELPEDLVCLCRLCHDACTMLECARPPGSPRVDPTDPAQRPAILRQVQRLVEGRRLGRRRELLEAVRGAAADLFDDAPDTNSAEGR